MRHIATLLLVAGLAAPAAAQTRIVAQANGWSAFGGTTEGGVPTCGLETRDPGTGRHLLLQHLVGQERPILRLSRPGWNLRASSARPVRIVIDNRRVVAADATGAGREMSWPLALEAFEPAFRLGRLMRIEFPAGPDAPWNLSLTGTNAVMGAFMGCLRMMAITPGEAQPIRPPPPAEPPALAPPPEEPLRPPVEPPAPSPAPAAPAGPPRMDLPADKAAPPTQRPAAPTPPDDGKQGPKAGPTTPL
ncbi:hypothetical protein EJV46_02420 [Roseococcus sp. SYP-B2431]|uniref:hypothetical protein n=1 Tax=Roseococcus sp. SYP-B2431 TaxID=2496640 RepID=UPI00103B5AA8|nr:hypothetical protein [Roseococcus sp. SYP-B2431]TCH99550.1 hypothetical protein EJV46_02420 [Roseococcus sp. SYP-B2431]